MEQVPTSGTTASKLPADTTIRLGTRASALARWQAEWVAGRLTKFVAAVDDCSLSRLTIKPPLIRCVAVFDTLPNSTCELGT